METENKHDPETFLVGLSPTFWSHVPLCIAQIHSLKLVNGLNCFMQNNRWVPLSRCRLVACVVAVQRKVNGDAHYVMDDGTGLLDCIAWEDDADALPPLVDGGEEDNLYHASSQCHVGDMVQVFGRIDCKLHDCKCIRELQISSIQSLASSLNRRAAPWCLDAESRHMLRIATCSAHTGSSVLSPATGMPDDDSNYATSAYTNPLLLTGRDALEWLGPDFAAQVEERQHFPAPDDTLGAWRLFGANCRCKVGQIKKELLYCHCIATPEKLDPNFQYRDALLNVLLDMNNTQLGAAAGKSGTASDQKPLFFQFQVVGSNEGLQRLATQQVLEQKRPLLETRQLLLRTVRALRQDGILHLYDTAADTYLLISRTNVLEPYMLLLNSKKWEDSVLRVKLQRNKPVFLQNVPKSRLQLVRRSLKETEDAGTTKNKED